MSDGCFIHRYGSDIVRVSSREYRQCQKCGIVQSRSHVRRHGPEFAKIKSPPPTAWRDEFYPDPKVFARMAKEIIRRCNAELADEIMAKTLAMRTSTDVQPMDSSTMLAVCSILNRMNP